MLCPSYLCCTRCQWRGGSSVTCHKAFVNVLGGLFLEFFVGYFLVQQTLSRNTSRESVESIAAKDDRPWSYSEEQEGQPPTTPGHWEVTYRWVPAYATICTASSN